MYDFEKKKFQIKKSNNMFVPLGTSVTKILFKYFIWICCFSKGICLKAQFIIKAAYPDVVTPHVNMTTIKHHS